MRGVHQFSVPGTHLPRLTRSRAHSRTHKPLRTADRYGIATETLPRMCRRLTSARSVYARVCRLSAVRPGMQRTEPRGNNLHAFKERTHQAKMAHARQSRPNSGLDLQVKGLKTFQGVLASLGRGMLQCFQVGYRGTSLIRNSPLP